MERISQSQLVMLLVLFEFTATISFVMGPLSAAASYEAWISLILAGICALGIAWIAYILANRRPQQFFAQYGSNIVGRWLHIPLTLVLIFYFIHSAAITLREFCDFMVQEYYPQTPDWAIAATIGLCVAVGLRIGVEAIFRCAQGFFFIILTSIIVVPFFINKEMDFNMMSAFIKHHDWREILRGTYLVGPMFGASFAILVFFPYIQHTAKTLRSLAVATGIAILCVLTHLIPAIMLYTPRGVADLTYPDLELIRYIRLGDFLENLDPILVATWSSGIFLTISLDMFCAIFVFSHLLKISDYKPLAVSSTAIVVIMSITMSQSSTGLEMYMKHAGIPFSYICQLVIPLFYLTVDTIRRKFAGANKKIGQTSG
jgi:spore germination protein KB